MLHLGIAIGLSLICLLILLSPFYWGSAEPLRVGQAIDSQPRLVRIQELILERYVAEQGAFESGSLSKIAWLQRKRYLTDRYIDATRRLDYLRSLQTPKEG